MSTKKSTKSDIKKQPKKIEQKQQSKGKKANLSAFERNKQHQDKQKELAEEHKRKQREKKYIAKQAKTRIDKKLEKEIIEELRSVKADRDGLEPKCAGWNKLNKEVENLKDRLRKLRG